MADIDYEKAFREAFAAARAGTEKYLREHPDDWFPCGFAWVHFPNGRDRAVNWLKHHYGQRAGHKGHPKGWDVWDPSGSSTQCMDAKLAGAEEFARVCASYGIKCYAESRWD
jgi:hypothetical protein